jgi:hypothetical protein
MIARQEIHWIAVPAGVTGDNQRLRLSVFVAPQLRTDQTLGPGGPKLAQFADMVDWASRMTQASFSVEFDGGPTIPATVVSPRPDPAWWRALFSGDTPLQSFEHDDHVDHPVVTHTVAEVAGALEDAYAATVEAADDVLPYGTLPPEVEPPEHVVVETPKPEPTPLVELFAEFMEAAGGQESMVIARLDEVVDARPELGRRLSAARERGRMRRAARARGPADEAMIEVLPRTGRRADELVRAALFYRRLPRDGSEAVDPTAASSAETVLLTDFHRMLSVLGDHPSVQRRLGLVVDLEIPPPPAVLGPDHRRIRVVPSWPPPDPDVIADPLVFTAEGHWFEAPEAVDVTPWTSCRLAWRFVALPDEAEELVVSVQVVPDLFIAWSRDGGIAGLLPLPAEQFTVQGLDVDGALLKTLAMALTLQSGQPERTAPPALRSGGLTLARADRAGDLQRGFVRARTARESPDDTELDATDLVRGYRLDVLDETTGVWRSLHERQLRYSVPGVEPIELMDEGFFHDGLVGTPSAHTPLAADDEVYVHEGMVTWDGWSLSVSRPGKSIRPAPPDSDPSPGPIVERPNNTPSPSLPLQITAEVAPGTLPRLRFGRTYRLRVRTVDVAGNGPALAEVDDLIARSGPAGAADAHRTGPTPYLRFEPIPAPLLFTPAPLTTGESATRLIVRSGLDDGDQTFGPTPHVTERLLLPPKAPLQVVESHGHLDTAFAATATTAVRAGIYDTATRESGTLEHWSPDRPLPYLPDPLAVGVVLTGLPRLPDGEPVAIDFDRPTWDRPQPIRLRLVAVDGPERAPEWDAASRTLTVSLAPAATRTLRIASKVEDPDILALLEWSRRRLSDDAFAALRASVAASKHPMFTPWQEITVVHAVQRPLARPDWHEAPIVTRNEGGPEVYLHGRVKVHLPSTHGWDYVARWTETVDTGSGPLIERPWRSVVLRRPAADVQHTGDIEPTNQPGVGGWDVGSPSPDFHVLGDTRQHSVEYHLEATSSFADCFPSEYAEPVAQPPDAPTRLSVTGEPIHVDVPSSATPPVPVVLDVVPLLSRTGSGDERIRSGGWIRLALARPWLVSGEAELLGILAADPQPSGLDPRVPFVTLAGVDPLRRAAPFDGITPAAISGPTAVQTAEVLLPEVVAHAGTTSVQPVTVVGFRPELDRGRDRWIVDLHIDTGPAYFPFVRLAVVRYQPHAIEPPAPREQTVSPHRFHVSPAVLLDIVQTLPTRTLSLQRYPDGSAEVQLTGPTYESLHGRDGTTHAGPEALARVTATVQRRDRSIADESIAWSTVGGAEYELDRNADSSGWHAVVVLPRPPAGERYRLLVLEEDRVAADAGTGDVAGFASRPIFAEAIDL